MIDESQAWGIAASFARSVKKELKSDLLALYIVGSLADGDYIPGRSDIDTILITKHSLPDWAKEKVEAMAASFKTRYSVPKSIGSVLIEERLLRPPYGADIDLIPEILRLKLQGKVVVGVYNLEKVPMPSRKYIDRYMSRFYSWLRTHHIDKRPAASRTVDATINTILYELRFSIWCEKREYVLRKREVIPAFISLGKAKRFHRSLKQMQPYVLGEKTDLEVDWLETILFEISAHNRQRYSIA